MLILGVHHCRKILSEESASGLSPEQLPGVSTSKSSPRMGGGDAPSQRSNSGTAGIDNAYSCLSMYMKQVVFTCVCHGYLLIRCLGGAQGVEQF